MKVYLYHDPRDKTPIYAGKGSKHRWLIHFRKSHNKHLSHKIEQLKVLGLSPIVSIWNVPDDEFACLMEQELIAKYGRRDLKTGTLCNFTDGGEGPTGVIRKSPPESQRLRVSSKLLGHSVSAETRAKISLARKGMKFSDSTRAKMSDVNTGKTLSIETKAKMSIASKKRALQSSEAAKSRPRDERGYWTKTG